MTLAEVGRGTTRQPTDEARAQHARSFHSLRHSMASTLANADVSEELRRRITGHESPEVHAKYTHHERETLARAVTRHPCLKPLNMEAPPGTPDGASFYLQFRRSCKPPGKSS